MGGSEHSKNEFAPKNNDMNANDQYKQGPEIEIGTDNPNGPESQGTDGGNVGTDVISPQEGASVMKVMNIQYYHLILHQLGKSLCIKNIWNEKQQEEEKKEKREEKQEKKKKTRKTNSYCKEQD
jgi:hypothetical protein